MDIKKSLKDVLVLFIICCVFGTLLAAVNSVTSKVIRDRENAPMDDSELLEYLPGGSNFQELTIDEKYPSVVTKGWKADGGFVFQMEVEGWAPGLVIRVGIDSDGKIVAVKDIKTSDTYGLEGELNKVYIGDTLDTLKFINITSGATSKSSKGYYDAVNAALQAAAVAAGAKIDPVIVLDSKIKELAPGFVNPKEITVPTGSDFVKAYKASNDAGFAYIYSDGENGYLVLVNSTGGCTVYDVDGNDVTTAQAALATQAMTHASANQKSYESKLTTKINAFFAGASNITAVELDTFGTIVSALTFKHEGADYYAFYSRSMGFDLMGVTIIIDSNGAIAKLSVDELFIEEEWFDDCPDIEKGDYESRFDGLTNDTWTGDQAIISSATMTSNAVKTSTNDAFEAFELLTGGNE